MEPLFAVGDVVRWRGADAVITGFSPRPACYKVRQGEMRPNSWYIVPFEDVSAVHSNG